MDDFDEREEELASLNAIYPELITDPDDKFTATLDISVAPTKPLFVRFVPVQNGANSEHANAYIEHDVGLLHLPPLKLHMTLPETYPMELPPVVSLSTQYAWLPECKLEALKAEAATLWGELGCYQVLFSYIDFLQQTAERGFDLDESPEGCHVLPADLEKPLVDFSNEAELAIFNANTYACGICLEPKRGSACYQIKPCKDVFCRQCLQDFYNSAISEGDVGSVKCLSPDCGKKKADSAAGGKSRKNRKLQPRELLEIGIEKDVVKRYVDMRRKKLMEADKTTIYCPRTWCQGPAKSAKYPPIPEDLSAYRIEDEESDDGTSVDKETSDMPKDVKSNGIDRNDRVAVCEKCQLAFCKVCYRSWHGPFERCFPRDPKELSKEEQASYDYIRLHTSPCPECSSPTQKTMGCNHMICFQCRTHFCYLCGSWLIPDNPYSHFNKPGKPCYQRLWELEEGDEGQPPGDGRGFVGARHWEQAVQYLDEDEMIII